MLETWVVYQNTIHCCKKVVHDCSFSFPTCFIETLSRLISSSKEILNELISKFISKCFVSVRKYLLIQEPEKILAGSSLHCSNNLFKKQLNFLQLWIFMELWDPGHMIGLSWRYLFSPTCKEINIKFVLLACWNCGFMLLMCKIQVMYVSFSGCVMRNIYDGALLYL